MIRRSCQYLATALALTVCGPAVAQAANVDPQADSVFKSMTTYISGLKDFSAVTENTLEIVTDEGQKLQFTTPASLRVSRPDKLLAQRTGDIVDQSFYYDGKSLTLYDGDSNHYATVPAPATLDATLDFARDQLDVIAPGADLLDTRAYTRMMQDVTSGAYLGLVAVGGQRCHHLAYRAAEVDWQLWVREGDKPLPCKYVITSKQIAGAPEFTLQVLKWENVPKHLASTFNFVPPAGASSIDFLPVTAQAQ